MTRKLGAAVLALSVLLTVGSLAIKGGVGMSLAQYLSSNFSIRYAKAEITHETAALCFSNNSLSCEPDDFFHSDSYQIYAQLALYNAAGFQQALNQSIELALAPGTCDNFNESVAWFGLVPGGSLRKVSTGYQTNYYLQANIPAFFAEEPTLFDNSIFNLNVPASIYSNKAVHASLSLKGNANLCYVTGPMALAISLQQGNESACVNVPSPQFDTLDISSAFCEL